MEINHLSESEIQQYTFDLQNCENKLVLHIQTCEHCKNKAEIYKTVFSQINTIEVPQLGFNLTELVINQITVIPKKTSFPLYLILVSFISIAIFLSIIIYVLTNNSYLTIFNNNNDIFSYIILRSAFLIVVFQSIEYLIKYKHLRKRYNLT